MARIRKRLYADGDNRRVVPIPDQNPSAGYRSDFRRDYARLIHSPSFRRLQGKTQLFPGNESDFFRNRLTHSLEVAQIAKTIAIRLNTQETELRGNKGSMIDYDLVETAALAHDLGHPPFGHNGEAALDECMGSHGGFEGNAQTLRILCRTEKKLDALELLDENQLPRLSSHSDDRVGLNLTYRALAAILKYDHEIPHDSSKRNPKGLVKGYYYTERAVVDKIKENVIGGACPPGGLKTIECQIMDIADDIAYSTYDLEDTFKAGFMDPLRLIAVFNNSDGLVDKILGKVNEALAKAGQKTTVDRKEARELLLELFGNLHKRGSGSSLEDDRALAKTYMISDALARDGFLRTKLTGSLVGQFVEGIQYSHNKETPPLSRVWLKPETQKKVELLKRLTYETMIMSPRLKVVEYRGSDIVKTLFECLTENEKGQPLLPEDYRSLLHLVRDSTDLTRRVVCDFIAGMTDRYAIEFYNRLRGDGQSLYRPL